MSFTPEALYIIRSCHEQESKKIYVQSRVCRWLRYARAATRRFNNFYGRALAGLPGAGRAPGFRVSVLKAGPLFASGEGYELATDGSFLCLYSATSLRPRGRILGLPPSREFTKFTSSREDPWNLEGMIFVCGLLMFVSHE